jgi:hypothetical protein
MIGKPLTGRLGARDEMHPYPVVDCPACHAEVPYGTFTGVDETGSIKQIYFCLNCQHRITSSLSVKGWVSLLDLAMTEWDTEL